MSTADSKRGMLPAGRSSLGSGVGQKEKYELEFGQPIDSNTVTLS